MISPAPLKQEFRLVVLISGNGSNLQAIMDAIAAGLPASIVGVISNRAGAYGLERAKKADIPCFVIAPSVFPDRSQYDRALQEQIQTLQPDLIVLAGFMRVLSCEFLSHFDAAQIINIHPSLLPKFPGLHTHQRAMDAQETVHGVSVHFVTGELDCGPIIAQMRLDLRPGENLEALAARIQVLEHKLYPQVIHWFAEGKVQLKNKAINREKTL